MFYFKKHIPNITYDCFKEIFKTILIVVHFEMEKIHEVS
jgi:hypothetical protein